MSRPVDRRPAIESGLNTAVEFGGKTYHVQTQCSRRGDPVVESLVFENGQALIRFTASFDDGEGRRGFTREDGRHLIEHQHANLIQKIRHGLLRGNAELDGPEPEPVRILDSEGVVVDPAEIDDPAVTKLMDELGAAVDAAMPMASVVEPRPEPPAPRRAPRPTRSATRPSPAAASRPWWRRLAITIRLRTR